MDVFIFFIHERRTKMTRLGGGKEQIPDQNSGRKWNWRGSSHWKKTGVHEEAELAETEGEPWSEQRVKYESVSGAETGDGAHSDAKCRLFYRGESSCTSGGLSTQQASSVSLLPPPVKPNLSPVLCQGEDTDTDHQIIGHAALEERQGGELKHECVESGLHTCKICKCSHTLTHTLDSSGNANLPGTPGVDKLRPCISAGSRNIKEWAGESEKNRGGKEWERGWASAMGE